MRQAAECQECENTNKSLSVRKKEKKSKTPKAVGNKIPPPFFFPQLLSLPKNTLHFVAIATFCNFAQFTI